MVRIDDALSSFLSLPLGAGRPGGSESGILREILLDEYEGIFMTWSPSSTMIMDGHS